MPATPTPDQMLEAMRRAQMSHMGGGTPSLAPPAPPSPDALVSTLNKARDLYRDVPVHVRFKKDGGMIYFNGKF